MVRILGNSPERIKINDLNDVIYYKQKKDYTDQEFDNSRDLQKEIRKGTITVLERFNSIRGVSGSTESPVTVINSSQPIGIDEIRRAVREEMSQGSSGELHRTLPGLINSLKQEILSTLSMAGVGGVSPSVASFQGPEYIPTISTEGMVSNIEVEKRETAGDSVDSNLAALRKLKSKK